MIWLLRQLTDIFAAISGFYYSKKYSAIARYLGLQEREDDPAQRGFIIVQIDALPHEYLVEAMDRGYAPYMKGMIEKNGFRLERWRCGLPSTTPSAQAGIMYGNNFDIPSYRWYEKETGTSITCNDPRLVKAMQDRVSRGRMGILRGGSSHVNMIDGDAKLSLFTLGAINSQRFFESVRGLGFLILFLLNPFRSVKIVALSIWEYLTDLAQRVASVLSRRRRLPFTSTFPFMRIITNVILRELQTFAVMVDVYRGVPAIYTTYTSYDEIAHHFGPRSVPAFRAIRDLDKRIKQIDRLRKLRLRRPYDLYVLSDHGMTPSIPFSHLYGCMLGEYIARHLGEGVRLDEQHDSEQHSLSRALLLIEALKDMEDGLSWPMAALVRKARRFATERAALDDPGEWDLARKSDVVVKDSGSMSHVYFNVSPRRMELSEITALFPNLMNELIEHEGIGLVVGQEDGEIVVVSSQGMMNINDDGVRIEGKNPLASVEEPDVMAEQVRYLASFPHSGDLILFGSYDEATGEVICFEDQLGAHGGLSGPQAYPFIVYPQRLGLTVESVTNADQLYHHFIETYFR